MIKKIFVTLFFLCFGIIHAHEIKGIIYTEDQIPLEGIGVYNKNNGGYTYSNISGYFELDGISSGDTILFYGLGYKTEQITLSESQLDGTLTVILKESAVSLDQVVLVSKMDVLNKLVAVDIKSNPVKSSQEILRKIPGLIIGQHAGGGKAEQIFLRGFDIDHGTDIAIDVDGMPVNMVSHAHGQGYADMHFIIPETINNIDFGKGPYFANKGNLNTAGYVSLNLKEVLDESMVKLELGQFNSIRTVGLFNMAESTHSNTYLASELMLSDGVFESPQNFNRFNIMGRYNYNNRENEKLSISLSHFQSKWDASGQIPQRAVDAGLISRFGAIDDTEGGNTSRSNVWLNYNRQIDEHQNFKTRAFVSYYDFDLFSNFTFFLEDPDNGDQIRQFEERLLMGMESSYHRTFHLDNHDSQLEYELGGGFRYDDVNNVQLSKTRNRQTLLERISFGNIDELNGFGYAKINYKIDRWTFNPGVRLDYFKFDYLNLITETYDNQSEQKLFFAPKFNTIYSLNPNWQLFSKIGYGFHSNDARVVIANNGGKILPGAFGADLGLVVKPYDRFALNAALWTLFLDQEFVYVGDAGIVEPSGKTRRLGLEVGLRYQLIDWLYLHSDINYTYARSTEEPPDSDYIPLAPDLTSVGGLTFTGIGNFYGSVNYRYLKDRPANEDDSIRAEGYFVTDLNIDYELRNWRFGIIIENLFDNRWKETQFATESRLFNEPEPVNEIHFTPGTPFFLRAKISVSF